jgi:hypothetical protein
MILGATGEQMEVASHVPKEVVRLDQRRLGERCGKARGERIHREYALQIAQTAGAALHVWFTLRLRFIERIASTRHG